MIGINAHVAVAASAHGAGTLHAAAATARPCIGAPPS